MSLMVDELDIDPERDEPNDKIWNLRYNKVRFEKRDPFGFWFISLEKGQFPEAMKGSYTSFDEATKAVKIWIHNKRDKVVSEGPKAKV